MIETIKELNRWEIKKIGLLNYWWYDEEEFEFSDGRMILRGTNGSGKSVTMQSFIPLLLDGNKSPERLDPFNTKARKIEDYILGYGEDIKEENTSYLYMELYKKQTEQYISIGMGLRAKRGNGVNFWGFILKDGRRIGKDFLLYKDMGNKIPLTKQELKNKIGSGGKVVENQKEYASLVNDNIFGFETLSEYQEFIKLLIEIRTPKLSKDGFKPSIITEIMSNSLRPLSDDDLKAVSESIENMNKTKEQLEQLQISKKALSLIITPYENYNKCILYNKAKKYNEKQKQYKKLQKDSQEIMRQIENEEKSYNEKVEAKQKTVEEIEKYKYKEKELKSHELWEKKEKQLELEKQLEEIKQDIQIKDRIEDEKKNSIRKKENEEKVAMANYEIYKEKIETIKNEMEQTARIIDYDEYFFVRDEINLEQRYDYTSFKQDIKRYIQKIETGKSTLEQEKSANNEYEVALENLDKEKRERTRQEQEIDKARLRLEDKKDEFIEQVYLWEKENEVLKLEKEELTTISQKVQEYGGTSEYGDILLELNKPYNKINQFILSEISKNSTNKDTIDTEIENLQKELNEWKNQKEPEPNRSEKVRENREKLKQKGIPYIEFYNAVEFKKEIKDEEKNKIESALLDMGILDALIIPKQYQQKIKELDYNFIDKYLFENPQEFKHDLTELLDVQLPNGCQVNKESVFNVLKSIMIEDDTSETYLNEDGKYKIGLIKGIADKEEKAKYIGLQARKEFKEKQIGDLQVQIEQLKIEKQQIEQKIKEEENNIIKLEEERRRFPAKQELEEIYNTLRVNINKLSTIKENVIKLENKLEEKLEKLKEIKDKVKEVTHGLKFNLTLEAYEEGLIHANELKENIFELEQNHNNILNENEKILTIKETLEELLEDLDKTLYEKGKLNVKFNTIKGKIEAIKEMQQGIEEIEKQIDECQQKLQRLPLEEKRLITDIAKVETSLERLKETSLNIEERTKLLEKETNLAREIFKQELDLKYIIEEYEEINKVASQILSQYEYFEKDAKDIISYYEIMIEKYRDNNERLLDYNLSISRIFLQEIEETQEELKELQKTRNRSDIVCFVNGKKVSLKVLQNYLEETIEETQNLVDDEDRHLFEEILIGAVGRKIRERIYSAKAWVDSMNKLMKSLNTSSGLSFSINWRPKVATEENELDTKEIVEILNSEAGLLRQEEIKKVATHFRTKFKIAEKEFQDKNAIVPFYNIIKETLDYRKWFEFQFMHKKVDEQSRELTNNAFFKLSGGEKAMAMYIPLFASVCARYQSAKPDCLRIISLDEAFAGVDDNNIRDMFRILTELQLEYIINSQVLWGEYDTIPSLSICELISDVNNKIVSVIRYYWNGRKREIVIKE